MIEGLKVTIKAPELQTLALKRAEHFAEKASALRKQLPTLDELDVPNSSNRPGEDARKKIENYEAQAAELCFVANHLDNSESYLLDNADLHKLGVSYRGY